MDTQATLEETEEASESELEQPAARPPQLGGGSALQGHLSALSEDNLGLFQRCAAVGGLVRFRVYWYTCHVLTDPELASALLVSEAPAFKKTRALQIARPTFGNGLVTSEGDTWRRQQRLLRGFFTPRAVMGYAELIGDCIEKKLRAWRSGELVDLHSDMVDVSLELVCRALFGLDAERLQPLIHGAAQAVRQWHDDCQALCLPYPHYYPTRANFRYRQRTRALDRAVYALIRDVRLRGGDHHGLLGTLLQVRDEHGAAIADAEIRDQIVTFFLAGHDTTASSLAFALYELSYRPDLQTQILRESHAAAPSDTLEQVLKEALRLYPAVHLMARTALRDVKLGPYLVRRGEEVVLPLYVMQRRADLFPRPNEFEPERWAAARESEHQHRYAHLPFSTGPRVCIGQAMAMAELRSIVGAVVRRFRLEPVEARGPRLDSRMTLAPAVGATRVRVVSRST